MAGAVLPWPERPAGHALTITSAGAVDDVEAGMQQRYKSRDSVVHGLPVCPEPHVRSTRRTAHYVDTLTRSLPVSSRLDCLSSKSCVYTVYCRVSNH